MLLNTIHAYSSISWVIYKLPPKGAFVSPDKLKEACNGLFFNQIISLAPFPLSLFFILCICVSFSFL